VTEDVRPERARSQGEDAVADEQMTGHTALRVP
jgi:hypothetical protein